MGLEVQSCDNPRELRIRAGAGYALVPCKLGELPGAARQDGKNGQAVLIATIIVEEGSCA